MKYILSLLLCFIASACATGERVLRTSPPSNEEQASPALEWGWTDPGAIIFSVIWLIVIFIFGYILYKDFTKPRRL